MSSNISEERARAPVRARERKREEDSDNDDGDDRIYVCNHHHRSLSFSPERPSFISSISHFSFYSFSDEKKARQRERESARSSFPRFFLFDKEDFLAIHFLHIDIFLTILLRLVYIQTHERTNKKKINKHYNINNKQNDVEEKIFSNCLR